MDKIFVTNTLAKKKERLIPRKSGEITMYVCGMTVQDYPHLGHARCYIVFDTIKRFLRHKGYEVKHVQNYTDIDDKIIAKANEEGISTEEVSRKYTEAYEKDMEKLGIQPADIYPLATEHIPEIIEMVEKLIESGNAYQLDGDVCYSVRSKNDYGKLSGRSLENMLAGERVEVDPRKKDPLDFALWKSSKPGEPSWESPWGPGRPGWHIECSAMSLKHLGMGFDIHGGGQDLIFPHHENEIAQSESYENKEPFVRYWLHNGFVNLNAEKMSKSTGNFVYLHQLLERFDGQVVRLFILSAHYRSPVDFTEEGLVAARVSLEGLMAAARDADSLEKSESAASPAYDEKLYKAIEKNHKDFDLAMSDDFNTPLALACLYNLKDEINLFIKKVKNKASAKEVDVLIKARHALIELAAILGLDVDARSLIVKSERRTSYNYGEIEIYLEKLEGHIRSSDLEFPPIRNLIEKIIEIRLYARWSKSFSDADRIRNSLAGKGVFLEDVPSGTRYYAKPW